MGFFLVFIESVVEFSFLLYWVELFKSKINFWIGLFRNVEGMWLWINNSLVFFVNWNIGDFFGEWNDCVVLYVFFGFWSNIYCFFYKGYICKRLKIIDVKFIQELFIIKVDIRKMDFFKLFFSVVGVVIIVIFLILMGVGFVVYFFYKKRCVYLF